LNFRDIPAKKLAVLQLNMIGRFAVNVVVRKRPNDKYDGVV